MNVLIVEDDPMVGQINSRFASKLSFVDDVVLAESIERAEEILKARKFEILLLDVYFPSGRGPELLQWIRNNRMAIDVIFITADKSPETVERALHLGAVDYIVKPFTFERFKKALENVRDRAGEFDREGEFSQESLDQVFGRGAELEDEPVSEVLDKGMSYKTYDLVLREVMKAGAPFTAEQMGEKLGIARVTIRRYLDYMEKKGILEVDLLYGRIGRPLHYYKLRGQG